MDAGTAASTGFPTPEFSTLGTGCLQVVHRFYERFTGLPLDRIEEETDRDNFMNPKQAMELGLIDDVIVSADLPTLATAHA